MLTFARKYGNLFCGAITKITERWLWGVGGGGGDYAGEWYDNNFLFFIFYLAVTPKQI